MESEVGEPFIGKSGQKLRDAVALAGIRPCDVAYGNACRHRPIGPDGRDRPPTLEEITKCSAWLRQDIETFKPRVILAAGKVAEKALGLLHVEYRTCHHPAYILRMPRLNQDFLQAIYDAGRAAGVTTSPIHMRPGGPPPPKNPEPWSEDMIDWDSDWVAVDTETDSLAEEGFSSRERLVTMQLSDGRRAYLTEGRAPVPSRVWVHNGIFDLPLLGIDPHKLSSWHDTMLMAYVIRHPEVGLKKLGPKLTGLPMKSITSVIGSGKNQIPFSVALEATPEAAREYALLDAVVTSRIARILSAQLDEEPLLRRYYENIEKPTLPALYEMETNGVYIDGAALEPVKDELERMRQESTAALTEVLGEGINFGSPDQLRPLLPELGFKISKTTETGKLSTDEKVLLKAVACETFEQLEERQVKPTKNEYITYHILRLRQAEKFESTYVNKCLEVAGGRLHGRFKQCVTTTNRLASADPNLQNIPKRTELGLRIRRAFAAPPGRVLVRSDLSQIEVRLLAHYTQDEELVRAYNSTGMDVHGMVRDALGLEKTSKARDVAKNGVFAMAYGADVPKFAETVHVPESEAVGVMRDFKRAFPRASAWREQVLEELYSRGYLESLLGWRIYAPMAWSPIYSEAQDAIRTAVNAPIQSSAAGILKRWIIETLPEIKRLGGLILLTVHDEICVEIDEGNASAFAALFSEAIQDVGRDLDMRIPLVSDTTSGPNWADCH